MNYGKSNYVFFCYQSFKEKVSIFAGNMNVFHFVITVKSVWHHENSTSYCRRSLCPNCEKDL